MSNKPVIYLHIGAPKTGSSALQRFCMRNRDALLEMGVLYPSLCENEPILHNVFIRPVCKPSPTDGIWSEGPKNRYASKEELQSCLSAEIEKCNPKKVIVSSEVFFIHKAFFEKQISFEHLAIYARELFDQYDVKIIVYLRRQDLWVESCYGESIKGAHSAFYGTINDYILYRDKSLCDYKSQLEPWAKEFSKENIIVRRYSSEYLPEGIIPDFLSVIGVESTAFSDHDLKNQRENISLDVESIEFIRLQNLINRHLPEGEKLAVPFRPNMIRNTGLGTRAVFLAPEDRRSLLESLEQSNKRVVDEYLSDGERLFLKEDDYGKYIQSTMQLSTEALAVRVLQIMSDIWALCSQHGKEINNLRIHNKDQDTKFDTALLDMETLTEKIRDHFAQLSKQDAEIKSLQNLTDQVESSKTSLETIQNNLDVEIDERKKVDENRKIAVDDIQLQYERLVEANADLLQQLLEIQKMLDRSWSARLKSWFNNYFKRNS